MCFIDVKFLFRLRGKSMIINYNEHPDQSLILVSTRIYGMIKEKKYSINEIVDKCLSDGISFKSVFLAFDLLFLVGKIQGITNDEVKL